MSFVHRVRFYPFTIEVLLNFDLTLGKRTMGNETLFGYRSSRDIRMYAIFLLNCFKLVLSRKQSIYASVV